MKNILITGASSGLGRSLFEILQNKYSNANFYLISSQAKSKEIKEIIKNKKIFFFKQDLAKIKSVFKLLKKIKNISFDLIINNAGRIYNANSAKKNLTLNFLSHFFLSLYFLKKSKKKKIKIINISTFYAKVLTSEEKNYLNLFKVKNFSPTKSYALSKLFLMIMANYFRKKYSKNCKIFNVDPGILNTSFKKETNLLNEIASNIIRAFFGKDPGYVAREIINAIEENHSFANSKYNYESHNKKNYILTDTMVQDKIFKISYQIYKKLIKNI